VAVKFVEKKIQEMAKLLPTLNFCDGQMDKAIIMYRHFFLNGETKASIYM